MKHKLLLLIASLLTAVNALAQEFGAIATSGGITASVTNGATNPWTFDGNGTASVTASGSGYKNYTMTISVDSPTPALLAFDYVVGANGYTIGSVYLSVAVDGEAASSYYPFTGSIDGTGVGRALIPAGQHTVTLTNRAYSKGTTTVSHLRLAPQSTGAEIFTSAPVGIEWSFSPVDGTSMWAIDGSTAYSTNTETSTKGAMSLSVDAPEAAELTFTYTLGGSTNDAFSVTDEYGGEVFSRKGSNSSNSNNTTPVGGTQSIYIPKGQHTYSFVFTRSTAAPVSQNGVTVSALQLRTASSQLITVDQQSAGNVGLEAVAQAGSLTAVRYLKVSGPMNTDDWAKLKSMTSLVYLDLSDATVTAIPASAFSACPLRLFTFPRTLQTIGASAFEGRNLEGDVVIPEGVTTIGQYAFRNARRITSVTLPDALTSLGTEAFKGATELREVTLGSGLAGIPADCFNSCRNLRTVSGAESVTAVGNRAFDGCTSLATIDLGHITAMGSYAFYNCTGLAAVDLGSVTTMGSQAFYNCTGLTAVVLSDVLAAIPDQAFNGCTSLATVTLGASTTSVGQDVFRDCPVTAIYVNAPAPPSRYSNNNPFNISGSANRYSAATLYVPQYAMASYKTHEYWSQYLNYEANTNALSHITLGGDLVLTSAARIPDAPDFTVGEGGHLTVNGDEPQAFGAFTVKGRNSAERTGVLVNRCANVTSTASAVDYNLGYNSTPYWYYLCLPFDVRVADITNSAGAQLCIREYDAAGRAEHGPSGNWRDVASDATLRAGRGYIVTPSAATTAHFPATAETAARLFATDAVTTTLEAHPSAQATDAGWNLVGNAYPALYDIYHMDYTAPITVWNVDNRTYTAYSVADDDFVLLPFQAFFVQRPEGVDALTLQPSSRQTSATVDHSGLSARRASASAERYVVNVSLTDGQLTDRTRVVVNAAAADAFDATTDATKMMSYDGAPQLYTLADGAQLAINEGQQQSGRVALGMYLPADATYTLDLTRADLDVQLLDGDEPVEMPYTFSAPAGTLDGRFSIVISSPTVTGIDSLPLPSSLLPLPSYDLQGRRVKSPAAPSLRKGQVIIK